MHIPDGFLDTKTLAASATLSTIGVVVAWRKVRHSMPPERAPLLGVAAAFVFAAQMLNFPVAGGTSGHMLGATLVTVLLGPAAGTLILTMVLIVQSLLFADGGFLALGANIFNMALAGVYVAWLIYGLLRRLLGSSWGNMIAIAVAAWCSIMASAMSCAGQLAWSGTAHWQVAFAAMAGIHALIGIGEALITCMVIAAIAATRPDLLRLDSAQKEQEDRRSVILSGFAVAIGLILFVSPFASSWPDGLEAVAATLGFSQKALHISPLPPAFADYGVPGIASPTIATLAAGLAGAIVVAGLMMIVGRIMKRRRSPI
jgi:cobalt/nickel transport system permease protein